MNETTRARKGFTLIELMIVVAIIGILAAIAIPKFADLIRKSKEGATKGSLGALRSSLSIYYSDMEGSYPDQMAALTIGQKYIRELPSSQSPNYHAASVAEHDGTAAQLSDGGGWQYDNVASDPQLGTVWVDCTHTDTKGSVWSFY